MKTGDACGWVWVWAEVRSKSGSVCWQQWCWCRDPLYYRYSPSVYKPSAEPLLAALLLSSESHYWQHRHHDTPLRSTPLSHATAGVVISKMFPFSTIRVSNLCLRYNLRYHISVAHSSDGDAIYSEMCLTSRLALI